MVDDHLAQHPLRLVIGRLHARVFDECEQVVQGAGQRGAKFDAKLRVHPGDHPAPLLQFVESYIRYAGRRPPGVMVKFLQLLGIV